MTDPVYILEQPKHIVLSIIQVSDDYPKTKEQQFVFDMLEEVSDIIFIFSGQREIDYKKFTSLHKGCGYIVCKEYTRGQNVFGIIDYSKEIFNRHLSYVFINDWNIENRDTFSSLLKVHEWTGSTIVSPLIDIKRVSEDRLLEMYIPKIEKTWWGGTKKIWKKGCDYLTHYSESPYVFMKDSIINKLLEKSKFEEYIETFPGDDPREIIASLLADLKLKTLKAYEI